MTRPSAFAPKALLLPLATATLLCAQQATQPPASGGSPAPIVRTQNPAAPKPHLTTSFPVGAAEQTPPQSTTPAPSGPPKPPPPSGPAAIALLSPGGFNRTTIVLDPGHGGPDAGSRISDNVTEKDVTLALANRIRALLTARGFNVITTRNSDAATSQPGIALSLDDRAGIANHARPSACLLLHATGSGRGVHLYTSEIAPTEGEKLPISWLTAQAPWVTQSQHLADQLATALQRSRLVVVRNSASIRPVDSLTCPAVVLELAPSTDDPDSISDAAYQQKTAEAIAGTMVFWQNQAQPPARILPPPTTQPAATTAGAAQ